VHLLSAMFTYKAVWLTALALLGLMTFARPAGGDPRLREVEVPRQARTSQAIPTASYVLGGISAVGLLSAAGLGLHMALEKGDLDACRPSCSQASIDHVQRVMIAFDITTAVALVTGTIAVALHVMHEDKR
jgi:hypothetical protein